MNTTNRVDHMDRGPLGLGGIICLLIFIASVLLIPLLNGCATVGGGDPLDQASHIIKLGDGRLFGVTIPPEIIAQGRAAATTYLAAKYPVAAPYIGAFVDRMFPAYGTPKAESVTIPLIWSTNVTVKLRDGLSLNGSQFVGEDAMETIFVSRKSSLGAFALPAEVNEQFTPGQFAARALDGAAAAPSADAVVQFATGVAAQVEAGFTNIAAGLEELGK